VSAFFDVIQIISQNFQWLIHNSIIPGFPYQFIAIIILVMFIIIIVTIIIYTFMWLQQWHNQGKMATWSTDQQAAELAKR